jgi:hypothetical protein
VKKATASLAESFWEFASTIRIPSKDHGVIPFRPWKVQRYVLGEIMAALDAGIHNIVILKPRQIGVTTVLIALDLYWMLRYKGLTGAFITETDPNTAYFRVMMTEFFNSLPVKYQWPLVRNNKALTAWANGSRLVFQTAGPRSSVSLGRSKGLNFYHGSEVAYWGDPERIPDFFAALSERHPHRLYVRESTANGFNFYYHMFMDAGRASTQHAIFVPWWRHELYELSPASKQYKIYWDGKLTGEEKGWAAQIQQRWHVELKPTQWAWYRWKLAEEIRDDVKMYQDFPTLPEHAFQATGSPWLGAQTMNALRKNLADAPPPDFYRFTFGPLVEQMALHETTEELGQLTLWEHPQKDSYYVVSADPAFGASEDSDYHTCQVWRVERTRLVQVAEFSDNDCTLQQFAWVCLHLAGQYMRSYFILELQGPGQAVWQEIQRLQQLGWGTQRSPSEISDVIGAIRHYIYRRYDTFGGSMAWHWMTSGSRRQGVLTRLRDCCMVNSIVIRSVEMVEELANMRRQEGGVIEAEGTAHDDRVLAGAMAVECWLEQAMPVLQHLPLKGGPDGEPPPPVEMPHAGTRLMQGFFRNIGV